MNKKEYQAAIKRTYDWKKRPLSWSAISSFEYDPEQWYQKYIVHGPCIRGDEKTGFCFIAKMYSFVCPVIAKSKEMDFGSLIGKKLETNPKFLPIVPRHNKMEHEFKCKFGKLELVGYSDSFCLITLKKLAEYKTGKKAWDQKRVDEHGQLTMYLLMHYLITKIKPEDMEEIMLVWMPTQDNGDFSISFIEPIEKNIKIFYTKRTMMDILQFGKRINSVVKQMEEYAKGRGKVAVL